MKRVLMCFLWYRVVKFFSEQVEFYKILQMVRDSFCVVYQNQREHRSAVLAFDSGKAPHPTDRERSEQSCLR